MSPFDGAHMTSYSTSHTHTHARTHARTHTEPFYGSTDFVPDNLSEPVPEETFTHFLTLIETIHLSSIVFKLQ